MFKSASHLTINVICPSLVQEMHSLLDSAMTTAIMVVMIIVKMKYEKHHEREDLASLSKHAVFTFFPHDNRPKSLCNSNYMNI